MRTNNEVFARNLRMVMAGTIPRTTQKMLAEHLGVNQVTISAWVKGTCKPKPETLQAVAEYFGMKAEDFFKPRKATEVGSYTYVATT